MLADMRQLVTAASRDPTVVASVEGAMRALTKSTAARVRNLYKYTFRPRFVVGSPPEAWKFAAELESHSPDRDVILPFYYWITARSERLLYDYVVTELYEQSRKPDRTIRTQEVSGWIAARLKTQGLAWTPAVQKRLAQGMLAALRDFGILEGIARKRIASSRLAPEAFALLAFQIAAMGASGRQLAQHPDWRLFLLGESAVEHLLLECHQRHWLHYDAAGSIRRVDFPQVSFKGYCDELFGRGD